MLESARLLVRGNGALCWDCSYEGSVIFTWTVEGPDPQCLTTRLEEAEGLFCAPAVSRLSMHHASVVFHSLKKKKRHKNVCIETNSTRWSNCNDQIGNWQGAWHFRDQGEPEASPAGTPQAAWRQRAREPVPPRKPKLCVSTKGRSAP